MKALITLVKREYWENKTVFVKLPLLIGGIMILLTICSGFLAITGIHAATDFIFYQGPRMDQQAIGPLVIKLVSVPFMIVMWLIIFNYLLNALYEERKDKSLLFWQSMPVSETQTIASKLLAALVVAPICSIIIMFITELVVLLIVSIVVAIVPVMHSVFVWESGAIFLSIFKAFYIYIKQVFWFAPFIGWALCVSAWAKKGPFIRAIVPVILILIIEAFLMSGDWFGNFVVIHLLNGISAANLPFVQWGHTSVNQMTASRELVSFIIGLFVAAVTIIVAGRCRRQADVL